MLVTTRLVVITAVLVSCLSAQRPTASISPVFARYGIRAVTGATGNGNAELAAKFGPDVMKSMGDSGSHVAMLRNDGPFTIMDVIWIWTGITADGRRISIGGRGIGSADGIKSGDFLVSAPTFPLSQMLMQRSKQPQANLSGLPAALTELRNQFAQYTTVEASLDVVVLDNGTVVGPDQFGIIESRRSTNAAMAEISAKLNDASLSDSQLSAWLAETSKRLFTLRPNGLPDHSSIIGNMAQTIQMQVQQHGRSKVAGMLAEVIKRNAAAKQLTQLNE